MALGRACEYHFVAEDAVASERPGQSVWSGAAIFRPGFFELRGGVGTAELHAHHSVQVMVASRGRFVVEDRHGSQKRAGRVVIPPDRLHAIRSGSAEGVTVHVEPESEVGRRLVQLVLDHDSVDAWCDAGHALVQDSSLWAGDRLAVSASIAGADSHPAVAAAVQFLRRQIDFGPVRLPEVAAAVHISESRLAHLFRAELGLTFRAYVRWMRLLRAVELLASGESVTAAAHGAGFSDRSHLNRTCRRAFGAPPSEYGALQLEVERST